MLFNVTVQPAQAPAGGNFNISVQVEAADLEGALEAAKAPIRKSAETSAAALNAALGAAHSSPASEA